MGNAKEIAPRKRAVVLQYLKDGCKQKDIAKKLKLSESVVYRLKKRYQATGLVLVKEWMSSHGIRVLEWPGNSPDLNPIENLWMIMKRKVRNYQPKSLQDLIFYIKRVWCQEITPQLCQKLVNSMPSRVSAVLKNGGYPAKY